MEIRIGNEGGETIVLCGQLWLSDGRLGLVDHRVGKFVNRSELLHIYSLEDADIYFRFDSVRYLKAITNGGE